MAARHSHNELGPHQPTDAGLRFGWEDHVECLNTSAILDLGRQLSIVSPERDYTELASRLGYSHNDIQLIDLEAAQPTYQRGGSGYRLLLKWAEKSESKLMVLRNELRDMGRIDLVHRLYDIMTNEHKATIVLYEANRVEEMHLLVRGKITLGELLYPHLTARNLTVNAFRLQNQGPLTWNNAPWWDVPAYELQGQLISLFYRTRSGSVNTIGPPCPGLLDGVRPRSWSQRLSGASDSSDNRDSGYSESERKQFVVDELSQTSSLTHMPTSVEDSSNIGSLRLDDATPHRSVHGKRYGVTSHIMNVMRTPEEHECEWNDFQLGVPCCGSDVITPQHRRNSSPMLPSSSADSYKLLPAHAFVNPLDYSRFLSTGHYRDENGTPESPAAERLATRDLAAEYRTPDQQHTDGSHAPHDDTLDFSEYFTCQSLTSEYCTSDNQPSEVDALANPSTESHTAQNQSMLLNPTSKSSSLVNQATASSSHENQATASSSHENQATASSSSENQATACSSSENQGTASSSSENQGTASSSSENQAKTSSSSENQATASSSSENQATVSSSSENQATESSSSENQATACPSSENQATASSSSENQGTASSLFENQATASYSLKNQASASSSLKNQVTASFTVEDQATKNYTVENHKTDPTKPGTAVLENPFPRNGDKRQTDDRSTDPVPTPFSCLASELHPLRIQPAHKDILDNLDAEETVVEQTGSGVDMTMTVDDTETQEVEEDSFVFAVDDDEELPGWYPGIKDNQRMVMATMKDALQHNGAYILRKCCSGLEQYIKGTGIALSVVHYGRIHHFHIARKWKCKQVQYYVKAGKFRAASLSDLVTYYHQHPLPHHAHIVLTKPVEETSC